MISINTEDKSREWEILELVIKTLNDNGFLTVRFKAQGDQFRYVYCSKSEWKKVNSIVRDCGAVLSTKPEPALLRKMITGSFS